MSKKKSGMQIYTKQDKAILYCGYALLALFLIAIIVPMVYIVIASFMDPVTLQNKGISFDFSKWSLDAYERVISDKLPKSKHRHYRHTNRQQDIKEVAHFAGTIHIGCLTKLTRDPLIVGTGNDHIPDAECTRQDNRPHGIQQTDIVDEQVGRDQTAVEEHRDNE